MNTKFSITEKILKKLWFLHESHEALFAGTGIATFHVSDRKIRNSREERRLNPMAKIEKINHFNELLIWQRV